MREFSESEALLLRVVDQFDKIKKYQGITPEEHVLFFDGKAAGKLLKDGVLEKVKLRSFGQKIKGVRFSEEGRLMWRAYTQEEPPHHPTATDRLVKDVYLASRLSFMGEAVPKSYILKHHARANLYDAFASGLVAKVRLSQPQRDVVRGYICTPAGYAYLRGNDLL
ncbi:hypothetical protein [Fundidesulfovibrio soli]|uniref:hypothetical protein n=1 Tax=Fundidesulfovibrio soli TaxID=2922716 RepID=UPI001FB01F25|nr:hypothetical protein [Fundidesulfovibrio soli]